MQFSHNSDIIKTTDEGFILCPVCLRARHNVKLMRIEDNTEGRNIPLFCRKCGVTTKVDIESGQCFRSRCP